MNIGGKKVYKSVIELKDGDVFIVMSDGCPHAGLGIKYNFGWRREDIITFMLPYVYCGYTAKTLSTILVDECNRLYGDKPGDDTTACVLKVRKREPVNILFGPPSNPDDVNRMMSLFFSKEGKHIVCGGTTSKIAAEYLHTTVQTEYTSPDPDIPPISHVQGIDLVTEGIITVDRILAYSKDYVKDNRSFEKWCYKKGRRVTCGTHTF